MHNMYLGIAKTVTKHYIKTHIISSDKLETLQNGINNIRVPSSVGRIPKKIAANFSSLTADQLKNWVLIYSPLALREVLPEKHYRMWMVFVHATKLITRKVVSKADITLADGLILQFCTSLQAEFGEAFITPNFHMACHLADVIFDFGPVYSFWCYSFER